MYRVIIIEGDEAACVGVIARTLMEQKPAPIAAAETKDTDALPASLIESARAFTRELEDLAEPEDGVTKADIERLMDAPVEPDEEPTVCYTCGMEFRRAPGGLLLYCSDKCLDAGRRAAEAEPAPPNTPPATPHTPPVDVVEGERLCPVCQTLRPLSDYRSGQRNYKKCHECRSAQAGAAGKAGCEAKYGKPAEAGDDDEARHTGAIAGAEPLAASPQQGSRTSGQDPTRLETTAASTAAPPSPDLVTQESGASARPASGSFLSRLRPGRS